MGDVYTIPAEHPFAAALAHGLLQRFGARDLSRVRLLLPSRRAALVVRDAFLAAHGGAPLLLPRLVPVGDVAAELGIGDAAVDAPIPPLLSDLRRRFLLFALVRRVDATLPHEQAFRLADALAALLDELADEKVAPAALLGLDVTDAAEHWRRIATFLEILARLWPVVQGEEGALGRSERRRRLLEATAAQWRDRPPGPVVLAGVTGSVPAVTDLMAAVVAAPEGLVLLPGCDGQAVAEAPAVGPTHPQWGFARLLDQLGRTRASIAPWPGLPVVADARRRLLQAMTLPADRPPPPVPFAIALRDVERLEAPDAATEALAVTLVLRTLLETEDRAIVVAPDRLLARRIAAELARFGVAIEDSGGRPLDQTPPGTFALLVAHACLDRDPVVHVLAMLKHPLARAGVDAATCRRFARRLELRLRRGVERAPGWPALAAAALALDEDGRRWFEHVAGVTAGLRGLGQGGEVEFGQLVQALSTALDGIAGDERGDAGELWAGATGAALAAFLAAIETAVRDGAPVAPEAFTPMLASAMAAEPVRLARAGHPQIEILGRFEARLASAELVILTGLNEGVWPPVPDAGPWLGRRQRDALGLPPPEQHVGFAIHDFVQLAASAPRLLLTRSLRDSAGAPTVRARCLDQLDRVLARAVPPVTMTTSPALRWALAFDRTTAAAQPCPRPRPMPPRRARPTRLSVSDVERLIHNPYAVYAQRVLGLEPLDPPVRAVDARDRGILVHRVLEAFIRRYPTELPPDVEGELLVVARDVFDPERLGPAVAALWWPRLERVASWFAATEPRRRSGVVQVLAEQRVAAEIILADSRIELRGRIDRLDEHHGGRLVLSDYKTGTPPPERDVVSGQRPQLPLLGGLLHRAGGKGPGLSIEGLLYVEVKGGEPAGHEQRLRAPTAELVAQTLAGVERLLEGYADPMVPYLPVPRPPSSPSPDPYAPLARDQEWLDAEARR